MKIITEQILSVKGTQSCYNIFFSLPPFPKLSLSKQLPSKKELFIFEVFYSSHDHSVWSGDFPGLLKR